MDLEFANHSNQPTPITARVHWGTDETKYKNLGPRQCTATRHDGERCTRPPNRGLNVCSIHGGNSPLAKQTAQRMLLAMVEPAVETLFKAMGIDCKPHPDNPDWCTVHGATCPEWSVRVAAAKTLLSRAGYGEQAKLTVEQPRDDLSHLDKQALAQELENLSHQLRNTQAVIDVQPDIHELPVDDNAGSSRSDQYIGVDSGK